MDNNIAKININNSNNEVNVLMPVWHRIGDDGKVYINIAMLGIETYALNEDDVDIAIDEAIEAFFIAAEKYGMGIDKELEALGWKREKKQHEFNVQPTLPLLHNMFNTGQAHVMRLQLC